MYRKVCDSSKKAQDLFSCSLWGRYPGVCIWNKWVQNTVEEYQQGLFLTILCLNSPVQDTFEGSQDQFSSWKDFMQLEVPLFSSWYKKTESKLKKANGKDAASSSMINYPCWHQFEFFGQSVFQTVKTDLWELLYSYSPLHHQTWVSLDRPLFLLFWGKKDIFPCISEASSNICQTCNNYNYST